MTAFDASYPPLSVSSRDDASAPTRFIFIGAALILVSALLAGFAPIGFSIVAVFLFAGPHNWMEARYFLSQMPAHWGPLRPFFVTGIGGVVSLTLAFIALPYLGVALQWDAPAWDVASATWNTAMILWITALVMLRARQHPTRNWDWALPASLVLVAAVWVWPRPWEIFMVYLHPIIAMLFLWRVLGKRRRVWRPAFATLLATGALALGLIWWNLYDAPALAGQDMLTMRITHHAGAGILKNLSPHALVATHTFLEMLHYGVWIVAVPWLAMRVNPLRLSIAPLARRSPAWRAAVWMIMIFGALIVLSLWGGFLSDYATTRDVYFTLAIAHVLAEAPFLIRTL